jgi:quinol monooxygenase YgiN
MAPRDEQPYVRIAEIEIDPAQLSTYQAVLRLEIETSVRLEPGVLALYAVADQDDPARIFIFEIYADVSAYHAHLETPHFRAYKAATQGAVRSLILRDTLPIALVAKGNVKGNVKGT